MLFPVIKALLAHYRRHPLQILLVWLGLTLGVSLLVGVLAVNQHAKESYTKGEKIFSNPLPYRIKTTQAGMKVPQGFYVQLRRSGFTECVPIDSYSLETESGTDLTLVGIDPLAMVGAMTNQTFEQLDVLTIMQPPYPIMVGQDLASYLGVSEGEYLILEDKTRLGPIKVDDNQLLNSSRLVADIALVQSMSKERGFTLIACGAMSDEKLLRLKKTLPRGLSLNEFRQTELQSLTRAFHMNLLAMGMLAYVVGLFIFYQAMSLSFVQRQPLVGALRQIGVSSFQISRALLLEVIGWVLIGWVSGNVIGLMLAQTLMPSVSVSLNELYNANVDLNLVWCWEWGYQSLLMAGSGCILACGWPLVRLLRTAPIRLSSRLSLVRSAGREYAWQALLACVFSIAAVAVYQQPHNQEAGFVLIALLLISVGLITPFFISKLFTLLSLSLPGTKVRWFFADASNSMSYRGVAAMAFMLALASNIGIETMVGSFRTTTDSWLTQRLAADIYIKPTNSSAARISSWLIKQPEVDEVWRQWHIEMPTDKGKVQVMSIGRSEGENRALSLKVTIPDYWYNFHYKKGLMISESMALKLKLKPGDTLSFPQPMGDSWKVVGIYYDYGNPYKQVLLSHNNWQKSFAGKGSVGLGVTLQEGVDSTDLLLRVTKLFRLSYERIYDNNSIHSQAMRVFDRTFVVTDTLGKLTLFIAVCGLFFATLAGEISRQRQFALLRCLGLTSGELVMLAGLQLLVIGLITTMIALPLGLILAQLLIDVVMKYSFGWTMEMTLFPLEYIFTFSWTLLSLIIAGAWPVWRMVKQPPMNSLRNSL